MARNDAAERKRAKRSGQERGVWVHITAAKRSGQERGVWVHITAQSLAMAGLDPHGDQPWYRVWAGARGRFVVTMYPEPS